MLDVLTLDEAISQKCAKQFFERHQSKRLGSQIMVPPSIPSPTTLLLPSNYIINYCKLIQIDYVRFKPLTKDEKDH